MPTLLQRRKQTGNGERREAVISQDLQDLAQRWEAVPHPGCGATFVLGDIRPESVLCLGEALGREEEEQGHPFVGASGRRLRTTLRAAGFSDTDLSFANVVPRRPLGTRGQNRTPTRDEIKRHAPLVRELIAMLRPKLVLLLGSTPLTAIADRNAVADEHGAEFVVDGVTYLPTFHPAATLYRPSLLRAFEQDIAWAYRLATGRVVDANLLPPFPFIADATTLERVLPAPDTGPVYFDIEAAATPPAIATWHWDSRVRPILISFAWGSEPVAIVVEWNSSTYPTLRSFFSSDRTFVGQNVLQYDVPLLHTHGVFVRRCEDTYLIARLLDENDTGGLKRRFRGTLGLINHPPYRTRAEEERFHARWHLWDTMDDTERAVRIRYAALDAWGGIQDWRTLMPRIQADARLWHVYRNVFVPACAATTEMERTGLPVNVRKLWRLTLDTARAIRRETTAARACLPPDAWRVVCPPKKPRNASNALFNPGSPKQVALALFDVFGFPRVRKTAAGQDSTSEDALLRLRMLNARQYPSNASSFVDAILRLRKHRQILHMFLLPFMEYVKIQNPGREWRRLGVARIHGRFRVAATDSMRLASDKPNCQNLPPTLRAVIEAPDGWTLLSADMNALEVRGAADLSQDTTLVALLREGTDLHWYNTSRFLGINAPYDEAAHKQLRYLTKTLFFASVYGAGEQTIADVLRKKLYDAGVGVNVVRKILSTKGQPHHGDPYLALAREWRRWMFSHYPRLEQWHRSVRDHVTRTGEIRTWFGTLRRLPDALAPEPRVRDEAVRQAINVVPQSLSLLTYVAMRDLMAIRGECTDWRFMAQVHDSITLVCRNGTAERWAAIVKATMEDSTVWREFNTSFAVPLVAEIRVGQTWQ